jgi:hypothetical protein
MKSLEQLADEHTKAWWGDREDNMTLATRQAFIAGFRAGKRAQEAKIKELEIELDNWQHAATHGDDGL